MQLRATRLMAYGRGRPAWTPSLIQTALWLDAADTNTITLNGSTVSQWSDKSGNSRNAVQATAANQPGWGVGRNLLLWSEQFQQGSWEKSISVTQNAASAPNGTLTADKLTATTTGICQCGQTSIPVSTGGTVCFTARLKQTEKRFAYLQINGLGSTLNAGFVSIDLQTGQAGTYANLVGALVSPVVTVLQERDGYWALSLSAGVGAGNNQASVYVGLTDSQNSRDVTVASGGIFAWGAQLNPGTTADQYQQTTSAAQTLSAGLNGKATMAWPDVLNNRMLATSASFATQDVFIVARYRDGTQATFLTGNQGIFGGGAGEYIGLIGDNPDKWYNFCDFQQFRRNGGTQQTIGSIITALPLPTALLNSSRTAGALTATFEVGNDRNLTLNRGWTGIIAEVVVLSSIASAETRQRLEGYLAWKWGGF